MADNNIFITTIALTFAGALFLALTMAVLTSKRKQYDFELKMAELNLMRKDLETQMYTINSRLVSTEERWKDVNHLLLSEKLNTVDNISKVNEVPYLNFLQNVGLSKADLKLEKDLVFVLTPFHPDMLKTYIAIRDVCHEVGLHCLRGDENYIQADIFPHILEQIAKARLIIANIDGRNPNVFYELGIAHALDKPVILVSKNLDKVPFDIKSRRIILYKDDLDLKEQLKLALLRVLV